MSPLRTVVQHRRIEMAVPDDIPDGTVVEVRVVFPEDRGGLSEPEWDDSPTGIARWFEWLESLKPLKLTESERQQLEDDQKLQKDWECEQFVKHANQLKSDWE